MAIDFTTQEFYGTEIFKDKECKITLNNYDDISVGNIVYSYGLFGEILQFEINKLGDGSFYGNGINCKMICCLSFTTDERKCWVYTNLINRGIIEKIQAYKQ